MFSPISVSIFKGVNRIGTARLVFTAGDMPKGEVPESDDDSLAPGKVISVTAGYENQESPVFEGVIVSHSYVIEEGSSTLQIECKDYAFAATQIRRNNIFEKKKDSEAIATILGAYSPLTLSVDATTTIHNELVQYYCTDWDFILSRSDANGLVVITDLQTITVKSPDLSASPKLKITYGTDLIEFRGELSADEQQAGIEAVAWNPADQNIIKVQGKNPTLNDQGTDKPEDMAKSLGDGNYTLQTEFCAEESSLQSWADAQAVKAGLSRIQGYCKFPGSAKALPGDLIELDGLGKRFNGNAYIGYVEHEIKEGEWVTTAGLGLLFENVTDKTDVMAPAASGFLPGISGLHVGKVTRLDADPTCEYKIEVDIPILNATAKVWARLANFWGSTGYGAFFIPDIGDEVVLGFFNDDPCHAVILGSLYSSKQKPAYELTANNTMRAISTKSKMKIEFDEEKKSITIQTPGNNSIQISDDAKGLQLTDQNNNKIILNDGGIQLESSKDLTLKATNNVVIDAGAAAQVKAQSDIEMKGINIKANASAELTLKGNAKAELSAAGQTVIKGAMVMIN
jgi:Rhs element Vgr protein